VFIASGLSKFYSIAVIQGGPKPDHFLKFITHVPAFDDTAGVPCIKMFCSLSGVRLVF